MEGLFAVKAVTVRGESVPVVTHANTHTVRLFVFLARDLIRGRSMSPISKESGICFYFARGKCTRDKCPYKHEKPAAPAEISAAPAESSSQRRTDSPAPLPQDF